MMDKVKVDKEFLDANQYTEEGITSYEFVFGENFVSSGGLESTSHILENRQNLNENSKILDIGSGLGGSCIYLNEKYGSHVLGVDISANMIRIARSRNKENDKIHFEMCDILDKDFPENSFDLIYSRDSILHLSLHQKEELFKKCHTWLKPQGILLITDYCSINQDLWDDEFKAYVGNRQYTLITLDKYKNLIEKSGLKEVKTEDITEFWIKSLTSELSRLEENKSKFLKLFSEEQYSILHDGWKRKIKDAKRGMHLWGYFEFVKC